MNNTIIKECPRHGLSEHIIQSNGTFKCKECRKDAITDLRHRNKLKLVEYKGGKCQICGYDKCIDALEFHHLNPEEKDFGLSCGETKSIKKLMAEADKCIMLCANCHRELHAKEREEKINNRYISKLKSELLFFENNKGTNNKKSQGRINLSNERVVEKILNEASTKVPKKIIAKKYNITIEALKSLLEKNNVIYNESSKKNITNAIEVEDFISKFKIYGNFKKVAECYGITDSAIRKYCKKKNLPWRKREMLKFLDNNGEVTNVVG